MVGCGEVVVDIRTVEEEGEVAVWRCGGDPTFEQDGELSCMLSEWLRLNQSSHSRPEFLVREGKGGVLIRRNQPMAGKTTGFNSDGHSSNTPPFRMSCAVYLSFSSTAI